MDYSKLTDAELIELEKLLRDEEIYQRQQSLIHLTDETPKNYRFIYESANNQRYEGEKLVSGFKGIILEGSARSRKTISMIDFLVYCGIHLKKPLTVTIIKETYAEFKTTLYIDFRTILTEFGLDNPFERLQEVATFKIGKVRITFIGADQVGKFHGLTSDIVYMNEGLTIAKNIFQQATMRCNWFWCIDYNPSVTEHYIFNEVVTRPDVGFLRTTFLDNPKCPLSQKLEILGYEPWLPGSYVVLNNEIWYNGSVIDEKNQPPPHPENVSSGRADEFMWKVYGLGLRGAMKGVIFKNVFWIDELPNMAYTYAIDFGFSVDPSAIGRACEDENNIYAELLFYSPIDNPYEIDATFTALGMEKHIPITADSSDKYINHTGSYEMVSALYDMGWEISKVSKTNSVMFWLTSMKRKKIHIVRPKNEALYQAVKKEVENYRFKEVNGILINQPIDKFNHFWDQLRYNHMSHASNYDVDEY